MAATTQHLAVVAMFVAIIAGRLLAERGVRALTIEQKGMSRCRDISPSSTEDRAVAILVRRELSRDSSP